MDYKEAALVVARILEPYDRLFYSRRVPAPTGENDPIHYMWGLSTERGQIQGKWGCGSAVPLLAYTEASHEKRKERFRGEALASFMNRSEVLESCRQMFRVSLFDDKRRQAVRQAWRPGIVDILPSAVTDCRSIEGFDGWEDWADDFGALQDVTPARIRELQESFAWIRSTRPKLAAIFGSEWNTLTEACGNL